MSHARRRVWVVSLVALGALCVGTALGQNPEPSVPLSEAIPVTPQVAPLEEKKLDQYAVAFVAIEGIERDAEKKLAQTQDPQASLEIKAAAEEQIMQAVERSGLQLNEFNQIAELAARNEALRRKLTEKVDQRRGT